MNQLQSCYVAAALFNPVTLEIHNEEHYELKPGDEFRCFVPDAASGPMVSISPVSFCKNHLSVVGSNLTDVEEKFDAILMRNR